MQHHEPKLSDEINALFQQVDTDPLRERQQELAKQLGLGPTGQFPDGKLSENDEGELLFAITIYKGTVVINFGKPIASMGLSPEQALVLARALRRRANEIQGGSKAKRQRKR
jgi:hypothetical protein